MAKTIELTEEQFNAALTAASKGGAQSVMDMLGQRPAQMSTEEMFTANAEARRQGPTIPVEVVDNCKSHVSTSTFRAKVVRGIVTELLDYTHPLGIDKEVRDGGLVTNGLPILDDKGQQTPLYKQWLWDNFWQLDIRTYVGRPLPKYVVGEQ